LELRGDNCKNERFPMANFTSNTYTLKRKILTFSNKISKQLSKPDRKFTADITIIVAQLSRQKSKIFIMN